MKNKIWGALLKIVLIATSASAFAVNSTNSGVGVLGTPADGSTVSGIGVISGYHCTAEDIDIYIDGVSVGKAGAGTTLLGTQNVCGRTNTGYSLLYNFNNLQPGQHVVEAYANGIFLESHDFYSVQSGGMPWLSGASKTTTVQDFPSPGQTATLEWVQSYQNFLVTNIIPVSGSSGSTMYYPLLHGFKNLIANGLTKSFTLSGTCTGSGSKSSSPATTPATFEGVAGLSATTTVTMSLTGCTPASIAQTSTGYFDNNYVPLGFHSVGVNYGVYQTPPNIPTFVTVGETGIYGTQTLYTNNARTTVNGTLVQSYVIEAGTSATAIVNLISKVFNASGTLTATEQTRYRIDASGTLTPVSFEIQYANGSTTHLIGTF